MPCPRFCPAKALARDCIAIGGFYAAKTFGNPTGGIRQGAVFRRRSRTGRRRGPEKNRLVEGAQNSARRPVMGGVLHGVLHPAVEGVLRSSRVSTVEGRVVRVHSYMHIPRDECELLYRQVAATGATQAIEVGMAFGISTLCLCDALCRNTPLETGKRPHLVVMDPQQPTAIAFVQCNNSWQGHCAVHHSTYMNLCTQHSRTRRDPER
jgi:hypothetical protein